MTVPVPERNVIRVSCEYRTDGFHGPQKKYFIRLSDGAAELLDRCEFEFRDLSYTMTYTVMVSVLSGLRNQYFNSVTVKMN